MGMKFVGGLILIATSFGAFTYGVQEQDSLQKDTTAFMKRKLDGSRKIIEGLATEDYDLISKSAQDLMLLSHEADWNVIQTKPYLRMSSDFRSSAERLRDAANANNLDGATLGYFEVTLNCVRCHKYLRRNKGREKK